MRKLKDEAHLAMNSYVFNSFVLAALNTQKCIQNNELCLSMNATNILGSKGVTDGSREDLC